MIRIDEYDGSPIEAFGDDGVIKGDFMGSSKPKWLIKQARQKVHDARRAARAKNPGTKNLGVVRIAQHGGANKKAHP